MLLLSTGPSTKYIKYYSKTENGMQILVRSLHYTIRHSYSRTFILFTHCRISIFLIVERFLGWKASMSHKYLLYATSIYKDNWVNICVSSWKGYPSKSDNSCLRLLCLESNLWVSYNKGDLNIPLSASGIVTDHGRRKKQLDGDQLRCLHIEKTDYCLMKYILIAYTKVFTCQ